MSERERERKRRRVRLRSSLLEIQSHDSGNACSFCISLFPFSLGSVISSCCFSLPSFSFLLDARSSAHHYFCDSCVCLIRCRCFFTAFFHPGLASSLSLISFVFLHQTRQAKTQLIAHDKEVYDIAFAPSADVFASVGADGSVRMFDLRSLEHSTIIYESPDLVPLLRLAWNKQDHNYLATFLMDQNKVVILDIR